MRDLPILLGNSNVNRTLHIIAGKMSEVIQQNYSYNYETTASTTKAIGCGVKGGRGRPRKPRCRSLNTRLESSKDQRTRLYHHYEKLNHSLVARGRGGSVGHLTSV